MRGLLGLILGIVILFAAGCSNVVPGHYIKTKPTPKVSHSIKPTPSASASPTTTPKAQATPRIEFAPTVTKPKGCTLATLTKATEYLWEQALIYVNGKSNGSTLPLWLKEYIQQSNTRRKATPQKDDNVLKFQSNLAKLTSTGATDTFHLLIELNVSGPSNPALSGLEDVSGRVSYMCQNDSWQADSWKIPGRPF